MIKSILMLWIIGLKYMMMSFKILQSKEIDLQQLSMMSETTLLTTSTVIVVLLNGKMIVHEIEFKTSNVTSANFLVSLFFLNWIILPHFFLHCVLGELLY